MMTHRFDEEPVRRTRNAILRGRGALGQQLAGGECPRTCDRPGLASADDWPQRRITDR